MAATPWHQSPRHGINRHAMASIGRRRRTAPIGCRTCNLIGGSTSAFGRLLGRRRSLCGGAARRCFGAALVRAAAVRAAGDRMVARRGRKASSLTLPRRPAPKAAARRTAYHHGMRRLFASSPPPASSPSPAAHSRPCLAAVSDDDDEDEEEEEETESENYSSQLSQASEPSPAKRPPAKAPSGSRYAPQAVHEPRPRGRPPAERRGAGMAIGRRPLLCAS